LADYKRQLQKDDSFFYKRLLRHRKSLNMIKKKVMALKFLFEQHYLQKNPEVSKLHTKTHTRTNVQAHSPPTLQCDQEGRQFTITNK